MKETFAVETWNVKVGRRFYSFDYKLTRNGKVIDEGGYDSGHTRAPQTIRKYLKSGYATKLVLERNL